MVTSRWSELERRQTLRAAVSLEVGFEPQNVKRGKVCRKRMVSGMDVVMYYFDVAYFW